MAIRLVHQPIGIGGLAAYAAGRNRARKYFTGAPGRGRAEAAPEGRWIDPLAPLDPALAALAPPLAESPLDAAPAPPIGPKTQEEAIAERRSEREAELARRRNLITQRAQLQAAARAGRMGRKYYGNLLPYFVPQAEIERRQKLADEERDRAFMRERDEAAHVRALERDRAGFARDDMQARRRAVEREVASFKIPDWVSHRDRIELEKRKAAVGEFARPDVDLSDPAMGEAYGDAIASLYGYLEGLEPPDPNEGGLVLGEDGRFRAPQSGERATHWNAGPGQPPVPLKQPEDLAAEQAAELRDEYNKAYSTRLKSLLGTKDDNDDEYTFETADQEAKEYAANVVQGLAGVRNRQAPVKAPGAFLGPPEDAPPVPAAPPPVVPPAVALAAATPGIGISLPPTNDLMQPLPPAVPPQAPQATAPQAQAPYAPSLGFDEAMQRLNSAYGPTPAAPQQQASTPPPAPSASFQIQNQEPLVQEIAAGALPSPQTEEEIERLPAGTMYLWKDGTVRKRGVIRRPKQPSYPYSDAVPRGLSPEQLPPGRRGTAKY